MVISKRARQVLTTCAAGVLLAMSGCSDGGGQAPAASAAVPAAVATGPTQYANVTEAFEDLNDYAPDTGEFQLLSQDPLAIRLEPTVAPEDAPGQIREEVARALMYGVYRTLIHTDAQAVRVVVVPRAVDIQKKTITPLDAYQAEVYATRERADAVARDNGFDGLASMVESSTDAWTEAVKNYSHANGAAGSIRMVAELASAPKK